MTAGQTRELDGVQRQLHALRTSIRPDDPPNVGWQRQEQIVELLDSVTRNVADAVDMRQSEYAALAERMAVVETQLGNIAADLRSLCKVVRDGNGQPSMVHRLTTLESVVHSSNEQLKEVTAHANSIAASKMLTKAQLVAGLGGMLFTAIISCAALIATLYK